MKFDTKVLNIFCARFSNCGGRDVICINLCIIPRLTLSNSSLDTVLFQVTGGMLDSLIETKENVVCFFCKLCIHLQQTKNMLLLVQQYLITFNHLDLIFRWFQIRIVKHNVSRNVGKVVPEKNTPSPLFSPLLSPLANMKEAKTTFILIAVHKF